jgi:hypothetical protein
LSAWLSLEKARGLSPLPGSGYVRSNRTADINSRGVVDNHMALWMPRPMFESWREYDATFLTIHKLHRL